MEEREERERERELENKTRYVGFQDLKILFRNIGNISNCIYQKLSK